MRRTWLTVLVPVPRSLDVSATWMAAARGACANGDHVAEWRYRNAARLIRCRPPLSDRARCLGKTLV